MTIRPFSPVPNKRFLATFGVLAVFSIGTGNAAIIAAYAESPGIVATTVSGASTITFDSLPLGVNLNVPFMDGAIQIGSFDAIDVLSGGPYGGANASQYITPVDPRTTLTLENPAGYFGLWWSAGDPSNVIDFFRGSTLVAHFTTANLLQALPSAYKGNPSGPYQGSDPGEDYAYLNFFADGAGSLFDSVVLSNGQFESDNYALRSTPWNPSTEGPFSGVVFESITGLTEVATTATPEPATISLCGMTLIILAFVARRRSASASVVGT